MASSDSEVKEFEAPTPFQGIVTVNPGEGPRPSEQYAVDGNDLSGYDGVSDEYRTYAEDTQKPFVVEDEADEADDDDDVADPGDAPYEDWTQAQLSKELRERQLPVSGTKSEQIERLEEDDINA